MEAVQRKIMRRKPIKYQVSREITAILFLLVALVGARSMKIVHRMKQLIAGNEPLKRCDTSDLQPGMAAYSRVFYRFPTLLQLLYERGNI